MEVVAGLSIKNLRPRVWDRTSAHHLPRLAGVMVSYAEFHQHPWFRRKAIELGLRDFLGAPESVRIYLDNGAFYFLKKSGEAPRSEYEEFVRRAAPDWYPVPQDYIPSPAMSLVEQQDLLARTMVVNRAYTHDGYVPVLHVSIVINDAIAAVRSDERLASKAALGIGGIVPNLLRMPKARPYREVLSGVQRVREAFPGKRLHLFGVGGTATLHIAALLGMDSVDSSGWRNRAARGIVQLPGRGDRVVANLGKWRGRQPSVDEWEQIASCCCPGCTSRGIEGIKASGLEGFEHRATHNLYTLLEEANWIERNLALGIYQDTYASHLDNTVYRPLIDELVMRRFNPR